MSDYEERVRQMVREALDDGDVASLTNGAYDAIATRVAAQLASTAPSSTYEAFVAGAAFVHDHVQVTDSGCGPNLDMPDDGSVEEAAQDWADRHGGASPVLSADVLRGMHLLLRHLDEDGHDWLDGTAMSDVESARDYIDRLLGASR